MKKGLIFSIVLAGASLIASVVVPTSSSYTSSMTTNSGVVIGNGSIDQNVETAQNFIDLIRQKFYNKKSEVYKYYKGKSSGSRVDGNDGNAGLLIKNELINEGYNVTGNFVINAVTVISSNNLKWNTYEIYYSHFDTDLFQEGFNLPFVCYWKGLPSVNIFETATYGTIRTMTKTSGSISFTTFDTSSYGKKGNA